MSRSTDPGHFFQTSDSLAESARKSAKSKNTSGSPIKLPSKILAAVADPTDTGRLFTAEAAGTVRRVVLETSDITHTYTGPVAPLTCLAISKTTVFAGCWDKSIWAWDVESRAKIRTFSGHADFVKALVYLPPATTAGHRSTTDSSGSGGAEGGLLISGGADATIIVWDAASGQALHKVKAHTRGILALALDPWSSWNSSSSGGGGQSDSPAGAESAGGATATTVGEGKQGNVTLFSADTTREIRRWNVSAAGQITELSPDPLVAHETSVYALRFDADGDLWTASADKSAKCLVRDRGWAEDTVLAHPDFVRDVLVDEEGGWVLTACRDEEVRVWERGAGRLWHTFTGHFEEVTALILLGRTLVSVSIDATIRQWSLAPQELQKAREEALTPKAPEEEKVAEKKESLLTEEEERELAELMSDDD